MTDYEKNRKAPDVAGMISTEDFEVINGSDDDPRLQELRSRLGVTAGEAVAILPTYDAEGNITSADYICVDDDRGTRIRNPAKHGLRDPLVVLRELLAQQTQVRGEQTHEDNGTLLALQESLGTVTQIDRAVEDELEACIAFERGLDEIITTWKSFQYDGPITPQKLQHIIEMSGSLLQQNTGSNERVMSIRLKVSALIKEIDSHRKDIPTDATSRLKVSRISEAALELEGNLRVASNTNEAVKSEVQTLRQQVDDTMNDRHGEDLYIARIKKIVQALESDTHLLTRISLKRASSDIEDLRRLRAALSAKD